MDTEDFKRKLSAILIADVVGYCRLMRDDEKATIRTLNRYQETIFELIERNNGRLVDAPGDNIFAEFASAVDALKCAVQVQKELAEKNDGLPPERRMDFRIGINIGDVIQRGEKIYGDGVNVVARIESLADPGGICISRTAYDQVKRKTDIEYEYLGEHEVKNIDEPVRIYRINMESLPEDLLREENPAEPVSKETFRLRGYYSRKYSVIYTTILLLLFLLFAAFPFLHGLTKKSLDTRLPHRVYLAILPFETINLTGDATAFAKGLIVTINAQLTKLTGRHPLHVISASEIREKNIHTVREATRELGANLVMEGSLQQIGKLVRINYIIVDPETRQCLRGDTITAVMSNPFNLMDSVVASVLANLDVNLFPDEESRMAIRATHQPDAYNYYLTAVGYLQEYQKSENIQIAVRILQQALERDPEFAEAYAALGDARWLQYRHEKETRRVEEALSACNRALELNDGLAGGHVCLGVVLTGMGKYEQAIEKFRRALDLEPMSDEACRGLGSAYEALGLYGEAEEVCKKAIELKPDYWAGYSYLGSLYYKQGRYSEAAEQFRKVIELVPDHHLGYSNLGGIYMLEGRYSDAIQMLRHSMDLRPSGEGFSNLGTSYFYLRKFSESAAAYEKAIDINDNDWSIWGNLGDARYWDPVSRARAEEAYRKALTLGEEELRMNPRNTRLLGCMAYYHAMLDETVAAQDSMRRALAAGTQDPELLFNLAQTCIRLGDTDRALAWLEKAMTAGVSAETIRNTPLFDRLENNRDFQDVLHGSQPGS